MSLNLDYKFKKTEAINHGSYYYKKNGLGKRERPFMTPYDYGSTKLQSKKRGER